MGLAMSVGATYKECRGENYKESDNVARRWHDVATDK